MCHVANNATNTVCRDCGYKFGQSLQSLRKLLRRQLHGSAALFVGLLAFDVAMLAALFYVPMIVVVALIVPSSWLTYRVANKAFISRHSLKLLDAKEAAMPEARLLTK